MSSNFRVLIAGMTFLMMLPGAGVQADVSLFLLHHSTGRYFIEEGDVRQVITDLEDDRGVNFNFWDHDYNYLGLSDSDGSRLGYHYNIPNDNTDPDGLHTLWTTSNSARDSILSRFDVIAFKSCYPACHITNNSMLEQYKTWYNDMGAVFDQYPEKVFVVMSPPPLHRLDTNVWEADRSREFANWLGGEYVTNHSNIRFFNLFDHLAQADDGSETRNMLRYEFEQTHNSAENHPNELGNIEVGPAFAEAMVGAGLVPVQKTSLNSFKAMFR